MFTRKWGKCEIFVFFFTIFFVSFFNRLKKSAGFPICKNELIQRLV